LTVLLTTLHPAIAVKASRDFASEGGEIDETTNTPVDMEGLLQLLKDCARTSDAKSRLPSLSDIMVYQTLESQVSLMPSRELEQLG
jgi:hypothetical protein